MSFGIDIRNNAGQYLLSSEMVHYSFAGKMSLSYFDADVAYKAFNTGFTRDSNRWTYRRIYYVDIWCINRPVCCIDIPYNPGTWAFSQPGMGILGIRLVGANQWRLYVLATAGYTPPAQCVRVFMQTTDLGASAETYGMQIFNEAGHPSFDSGRKLLLGGGGSTVSTLWMAPAYIPAGSYDASSHWWWGYQTGGCPITPSCGSFVTGNCGVIANENSNGPMSAAFLYPLFSYNGNTAIMIWTPVFMTHPWNTAGTFYSDGSCYQTINAGPQSGVYNQKTILVDPAFY